MIAAVIKFGIDVVVGTFWGRIGAALLAGWVALQVNNYFVGARAAGRVIEDSKKQGQIANAKNEKVRERARQPGAAERLLKDSCRDC